MEKRYSISISYKDDDGSVIHKDLVLVDYTAAMKFLRENE